MPRNVARRVVLGVAPVLKTVLLKVAVVGLGRRDVSERRRSLLERTSFVRVPLGDVGVIVDGRVPVRMPAVVEGTVKAKERMPLKRISRVDW